MGHALLTDHQQMRKPSAELSNISWEAQGPSLRTRPRSPPAASVLSDESWGWLSQGLLCSLHRIASLTKYSVYQHLSRGSYSFSIALEMQVPNSSGKPPSINSTKSPTTCMALSTREASLFGLLLPAETNYSCCRGIPGLISASPLSSESHPFA